VPGAWGARIELDEAAAHHAGVKRLEPGDVVRVTSGDGRRATGTIAELARKRLVVSLEDASIEQQAAPPHVELWAPVGDRERMLLLAEKAVELGASAWRPILYRRSRSVSPRGEGEAFREKARQRMISALEQSGSAWLPVMHADATPSR
jgi:16S rRNA (uracil1498-N3)-methyltransferase